jgi:hypothetical protein
MKAFLSHSSKDAALVHQVARLVGGANVELDDTTFDRGLLNVEAIYLALQRASIFVLFLTTDALASGIVKFERFIYQEMQESGAARSPAICFMMYIPLLTLFFQKYL